MLPSMNQRTNEAQWGEQLSSPPPTSAHPTAEPYSPAQHVFPPSIHSPHTPQPSRQLPTARRAAARAARTLRDPWTLQVWHSGWFVLKDNEVFTAHFNHFRSTYVLYKVVQVSVSTHKLTAWSAAPIPRYRIGQGKDFIDFSAILRRALGCSAHDKCKLTQRSPFELCHFLWFSGAVTALQYHHFLAQMRAKTSPFRKDGSTGERWLRNTTVTSEL